MSGNGTWPNCGNRKGRNQMGGQQQDTSGWVGGSRVAPEQWILFARWMGLLDGALASWGILKPALFVQS